MLRRILISSVSVRITKCLSFYREFNSSEQKIAMRTAVTCLRPFYFEIHPDLFEQYPNERNNNEHSLKQLNNYIETIVHSRPIKPMKVKFFLRRKNKETNSFKSVNISLVQRDIRILLKDILSSCSLPTQYLDSLPLPKHVPELKIRNNESGL